MAPKLNTSTSVVDYLKSQGEASSLAARAQLAVQQGVVSKASQYTGTAAQNTALLKELKSDASTTKSTGSTATKTTGTAAKPTATTSKTAQTNFGTNSLVDSILKSLPKVAGGGGGSAASGNAANGSSAFASELANTIYNSIPGGGDYSYTPANYMQVSERKLMDAATLAKLYGLDYNYDNIYNTLMKGVNTAYGTRYAEQAVAEDKYYDNAAVAQNTLADTLKQQQSQAIMTGANRGAQAANALSAVLGTSQQFAANATQLSQDRAALAKEYAASQASTSQKALDTYNNMGQQLADISKNIYSTDTSAYVGELDYNSNVNTSNAQLQAQSIASKAQWETTLANDITSAYNAYYNGQITLQQAQIQAGASVEAAKLYGVDAATATAAANKAIANINATSNKQIAQIQTSGNLAAAQTAANATQQAAQTAANATTQAAQTSANSYAQQQQAVNQQTAANAILSLISGYNTGTMSASEASDALNAYKASGVITQSVYDNIANMFKPKTAPVTNNSGASYTNPAGNNSTYNWLTDWLKNNSTSDTSLPILP